MADGRYYRRKKSKQNNEQSLCRCVVTVFQVAVICQSISTITAQDYMQFNVEADGVIQRSTLFTQTEVKTDAKSVVFQLDSNERVTSQADVIRFDPPYLDFDVQPIGIPNMRLVHVYNPSKTKSLRLNAISARTSHFHSSFFDKKHVPPGGNASFEVVFLARVVGNVENTLFINAAMGTYSYQVFGIGAPNPYRLRPFLGAKVSINSTFSPLISIHNPTGTPLQVTEMYTSSGFLQLQLPVGIENAKKQLWEIPPYETRPVMQANFFGQVADNYTAFIRIKTNRTDSAKNLILPLEVEVSTAPGIYSSLEMLDFGTLRSKDLPKTLGIFLLNYGTKEVQVSSITVHPSNPALQIDFRPVKLAPSQAVFTNVANISFDVGMAKNEDQLSGRILIKTKEKSYAELSLSYQVNILNGNLGYDESCTLFHIPSLWNSSNAQSQHVNITNTFNFPIILHKLELPDITAVYFKVINFSSPCIVPTQSTAHCFSIVSKTPDHKISSDDLLGFPHQVILHTNASKFSMPLLTFTGYLTHQVQGGSIASLDFGIMGTLDKRQLLLSIFNDNPVEVSIFNFNSSLQGVDASIISLTKNGENVDSLVRSFSRNVLLPPGSTLTIEVVLSAPKAETSLSGNLTFYTTFEVLEIPLKARIAVGSLTLKPSKFKFRPTFPGMIVYQTLSITSSFAQTMKIESLTCHDKRFYYRKHKNVGSELEPGKELRIGKVYFDAKLNCKPGRCYVGLPTSTTVGHHWLSTLSLGKNAAEVDPKLYKNHQEIWTKLKNDNQTSVSTTFQLSTNLVRNFDIEASATLYWPSLVDEPVYEYPPTHIGKISVNHITLHNPSDLPVIVQIFPLGLYPQPQVALKILGMEQLLQNTGFTITKSNVFNVSVEPNSTSQDTAQVMWLEYALKGKTNKSCVNLFLNPGSRQVVDVSFLPEDDSPVATLIIIRNNLTVLDAFEVKGRGVKEVLKLGGKLSDDRDSSLKFKLTESLLRDCFVEKRKDMSSPSYTVRKSFTAKNLGLLQLQVRYMMVDNYPCEGFGFRIIDCQSFNLQPNETKDIVIVYTPDFTLSQVSHVLRIWTAQGNLLTFNLNVTLPHHLLPICQASIPRPYWENSLYYCLMFMVLLGLMGIVLVSYMEAMNILQPVLAEFGEVEAVSYSGTRKPFNLRNIAESLDDCENNSIGAPIRRRIFPNTSLDIKSLFKTGARYLKKLIEAIKFLRKKNELQPNDLESREPSVTDLLEKDVIIPKPKPDSVNSHIATGQNINRVRNRPNRKSKCRNNSNENLNYAKPTVENLVKSPPELATILSWPITSPKLNVDSVGKFHEDDKLDTTSASSIESSRSRGSSVSSANADSDRRKQSEESRLTTPKRRLRSKLNQKNSYINDTDESSSTGTDKSSEDFEVKGISLHHPSKRTALDHKPKQSKSPRDYISKGSSDSDYKESFSNPVHSSLSRDHNVRRRHPKSSTSFIKKDSITYKPKCHYSSSNRSTYDSLSTSDEPTWEFPLHASNQREADDVLLALSEKTRLIDDKMRFRSSNRTQRPYGPTKSSTSSFRFNTTSSVTESKRSSPSTSESSYSKKTNLTKARSVPDAIIPSLFNNPTTDFNVPTEKKSNHSIAHDSSFFTNPATTREGFNPLGSPNTQSWNGFGQRAFHFSENVISPPATTLSPSTSQWSVFNDLPSNGTWNQNNLLQINLPSPRSTTHSPLLSTSHLMNNEAYHWSSTTQTQSSQPKSTHAIWSVRNAVTMDEHRNTAESDPLGVKSIWNEGSFDSHNSLF